MIDFADHDPIFRVTLVMFDQMISCPLSHEFRTNLVDCIIGMGKQASLTFDTSLVWRKQVIDFGDHETIFKVT